MTVPFSTPAVSPCPPYSIQPIDPWLAQSAAAVVFPHFAKHLNGTDPAIIRLAAVAGADSATKTRVLGAVLVEIGQVDIGQVDIAKTSATVLSLAVTPEFRRNGIARALLERALEQARIQGAKRACLSFVSRMPQVTALKALLHSAGWSEPAPRILFAETAPQQVLQQAWAQRVLHRGPRNATAFDWSDLTSEDRSYIEVETAAGRYPQDVSPFWDEGNIAPVSLGLRAADGRVVGWLACHFVPRRSGTIRFSRSFCHADPAFRGNGAWVMAAALERHVNSSLHQSHPTVLFDVDARNKAMMTVYRRRIEPYIDTSYQSFVVAKDLC
ncbi:GNAT family N-acetyltransferase [Pseudophaeobacter arcticus]|uniref:GNAT family N-acetyltransferase n=1 Tax=Pseudophaeobacter arcticus TaxID=385492 RepID=UPI00248F9A3A|nr:GNAT family N-acetyltransferase [Pseudophaeobacter arcticus]